MTAITKSSIRVNGSSDGSGTRSCRAGEGRPESPPDIPDCSPLVSSVKCYPFGNLADDRRLGRLVGARSETVKQPASMVVQLKPPGHDLVKHHDEPTPREVAQVDQRRLGTRLHDQQQDGRGRRQYERADNGERCRARMRLRNAMTGGVALIAIAGAIIGVAIAEGGMVLGIVLLAIGLFVMGAGLAVPYALAPRLALSALSPAQAGQGSGIVNACTFLGGSAGVAGGATAFALGGFVAVLTMIALAGIVGAALSRAITETK